MAFVIYRAGRRSGYEAGRVDEREEWSTKIRELDE
jgi:ribosomal protein L19E